eukprot:1547296-Rhodomonas_salina.1
MARWAVLVEIPDGEPRDKCNGYYIGANTRYPLLSDCGPVETLSVLQKMLTRRDARSGLETRRRRGAECARAAMSSTSRDPRLRTCGPGRTKRARPTSSRAESS